MKSVAVVATDRPVRYGKQLVGHMSRKILGEWTGESGHLDFHGRGKVHLSAGDDVLTLELVADDSEAAQLEEVVGVHLARFGSKDALTVSWNRESGEAGTVQGPYSEEDMKAFAEARKARQKS
ncbi:MAG: DUF2218 domain-containing protein [Ancrocorticia sp.]|uniref:DUF2218 domain-containing protein n=1 Tax=Ancrocorticia sp. TaxID=2593684 RepID=UPI003F90CC42